MLPRSIPDAEIGGYCSRAWRDFRRFSAGKTVRIRPRRPGLESLEGRELLAGVVAEYPLASPPTSPGAITAGPDGTLWFINDRVTPGSFPATILAVSIGRITPAGVITEFPITTPGAYPSDITSGPDGALWFTENTSSGPRIGRITTDGVITDFPAGSIGVTPDNQMIGNITAGPDGALWFTETSSSDGSPFHVGGGIGRITTAGELSLFSIPSIPSDITAGPDGALWYTTLPRLSSPLKPTIGRITTAGVSTEFPIANYAGQITSGPDGALWFTEGSISGPMIGRITTAGVSTEFPIPTPDGGASGITAGPDGALWFTEFEANKIGRITTSGVVTEFAIPTPDSQPSGIATGSDGDLWFTERGAGKIGQLSPVSLAPPTVTSVRRLGFHADPTRIVLGFSIPLDPARARDLRNYRIVGPGNKAVAIDSATYDPAANTVTLRPHARLDLHQRYKLTVIGTAPHGVAETSGVLLDGAGDGQPGSNHVATLKASDLVLGAEVPGGPKRLAALRRTLAKIEADQSKQLARTQSAPGARALARAHPAKAAGGPSAGKN